MEKVYEFEPVPQDLTQEQQKHIIGIQANLWAEYIPTPEHAEYMTWPRLLAISEIAWNSSEKDPFDKFKKRVAGNLNKLDAKSVNYRKLD